MADKCGTCGTSLTSLDSCLEHLSSDCDDCTDMPAWPDAIMDSSLDKRGPIWSWDCRTPDGKGWALAGSGSADASWIPCILVNGRVEADPTREEIDATRRRCPI